MIAEQSMTQMAASASAAEQLLKLLANKARLLVLCQLVQGEKNVTELQNSLDISQSALSQHLAKMRDQGIIQCRRDGQQMLYSLSSMEVNAIMSTLYLIYCK